VSHHGSENGYCDKLWEQFSQGGRLVAVVTPQFRYSLPTRKALDEISRHASRIFATCSPRLDWSHPPVLSPLDGPPIESRITVREAFSAIPAAGWTQCGRCSLIFDEKGEMQVELELPAVSLLP
jgi:hypothetical protein